MTVKESDVPGHSMKHKRGVEVELCSFLTSALGVCLQGCRRFLVTVILGQLFNFEELSSFI